MNLHDEARDWVRALTTSSTDSSYASRVATVTTPADDGVLTPPLIAGKTPQSALLVFFGAGADNATLTARIIGWRKIGTLWVPIDLAEVALTLSTAVGVAGTDAVATDRFADTLV